MSAPASEPREEEPVAGRGERLRVALGSLLLGALLLLLLLAAGSMPAFDPDLFWVAASGRWMLEHLDVPRQNLFSFTAPEQPWVMHEWGFGPLYAWGLARFGAPFLNALSMLGIVALAGLLLRGTFWRSRRLEAPFLVALFALALAGIHMVSARPTIFARLFPLGMLLLAFSPRFSRRHALGAVVLEWVWASCHGSFPLGIVMLGISAFEDQERRRLRILACAGAAAITFIGPYGWGLHRLVFEYATGASESVGLVHESILEFRSIADLGPDAESLPSSDLLGAALVLSLALLALWRRAAPHRLALVFALLALGALQIRHLVLASLLGSLLLLPELEAWLERRAPGPTPSALAWPQRRRIVWLALAPAILLGSLAFARLIATRPPGAWISSSLGGAAFERAIARIPDGSRVHTEFAMGGRLIWLGAPRGIRVLYDSRNDCYPPEVVRAAFRLSQAGIEAEEALGLLASFETQYVLLGPNAPLRRRLLGSEAFETVSEEPGALLLRRLRGAGTAPPPDRGARPPR